MFAAEGSEQQQTAELQVDLTRTALECLDTWFSVLANHWRRKKPLKYILFPPNKRGKKKRKRKQDARGTRVITIGGKELTIRDDVVIGERDVLKRRRAGCVAEAEGRPGLQEENPRGRRRD